MCQSEGLAKYSFVQESYSELRSYNRYNKSLLSSLLSTSISWTSGYLACQNSIVYLFEQIYLESSERIDQDLDIIKSTAVLRDLKLTTQIHSVVDSS